MARTSETTGVRHAGCSKRPDFSPAQPWRLLHPPALSLPRQPLRPGTRLVPSKAAASEAARRTLRYVEPLSEARTKLADFFSILLETLLLEPAHCQSVLSRLTRIIHDGSSRNRAVATRDRRAEPRGREAYLKQYVDRPNGEPACLDAVATASRLVAAANPRLQQKRS